MHYAGLVIYNQVYSYGIIRSITFLQLFGNVDWLKTGHMTFYKKWNSTDVTNNSNTHVIYKFIFRNIRAIHDLSMYFQKHPCYTRFSNVFSQISRNFIKFSFFFKFKIVKKISKLSKISYKISKLSKNFKMINFQKVQNFNI